MGSALRVATATASWLIAAAATAEPSIETVSTGLQQPAGVAVSQGDLPGDLRLVVLQADGGLIAHQPGGGAKELARLPLQDSTPHERGQCLLGLDDRTLVAGVGLGKRSQRALLGLRFPPGKQAHSAVRRDLVQELMPDDAPDQPGKYLSLACNSRYVYIVLAHEGGGGSLLRARHTGSRLSGLRPLATAGELPPDTTPRAVTVSPQGHVVVAVESQGKETPSQLLFADPELTDASGPPLLMELDTSGMVALAYAPQVRPVNRRLYALISQANGSKASGLYRIDAAIVDGVQYGAAVLLAELENPTAMAFGAADELYVTTAGDDGALLKLKDQF